MIFTVVYGSQTGCAHDLAETISVKLRRTGYQATLKQLNDVSIEELDGAVVLFVVSTTGQGDPPDNMLMFWRLIMKRSTPMLPSLRYSLLGLGDSSYPKFNFVGKKLHRRLQLLGAQLLVDTEWADEMHELGIDGAAGPWLRILLTKISSDFCQDLPVLADDALLPSPYSLTWTTDNLVCPVENENLNSRSSIFKAGRDHGPYSEQNPYLAVLLSNDRITHIDHWQDVRLIKLSIENSDIFYDPGDVLMVMPENSISDVDEFLDFFELDGSTNIEVYSAGKGCFRGSVYRLVCKWLDINSVPRRSLFEKLYYHAIDELEKERLGEWKFPCSADNLDDLYSYCNRPRRTILECIQDFPKTWKRLSVEYLLDVIPMIRPRAFSIASSVLVSPCTVELLVAVVRYTTMIKKPRTGLCSSWLASLSEGQSVPVWVKKGGLKFPQDGRPVLMVGPGTGVAPFRSFIQSRIDKGGSLTLFFGNRNHDNDFLCRNEFEDYVADGILQLYLAWSRDSDHKVYVQHRISEHAGRVGRLIVEGMADVFIAGNAKNMPDQVVEALTQSVCAFSEMSFGEAEVFIASMVKRGKLQMETWG